jgi:hypothetical protein
MMISDSTREQLQKHLANSATVSGININAPSSISPKSQSANISPVSPPSANKANWKSPSPTQTSGSIPNNISTTPSANVGSLQHQMINSPMSGHSADSNGSPPTKPMTHFHIKPSNALSTATVSEETKAQLHRRFASNSSSPKSVSSMDDGLNQDNPANVTQETPIVAGNFLYL